MKKLPYLAVCALALGACRSATPISADPAGAEPETAAGAARQVDYGPWTEAFLGEAVLLAREVSIEGPPGLLEHFAIGQNPLDFTVDVRATPAGLLQEVRVREELANLPPTAWPPLRAQLDNLMIAVTHRLRVLERPGDGDVVVSARGEVLWKSVSPPEEKRGESLRLAGSRPR